MTLYLWWYTCFSRINDRTLYFKRKTSQSTLVLSPINILNIEQTFRLNQPTITMINQSSIYIKKNVCRSVCLFAMRLNTMRANNMKLSRDLLYTHGNVDIPFFPKRNKCCTCCTQSKTLTNRVSGFQNMKGIGSDGGRRPSERSSITTNLIHLLYLYISYTENWKIDLSRSTFSLKGLHICF